MISEANCITKEPCDAHEVLKCWNYCKKRGSRTKYAIEYSRHAAGVGQEEDRIRIHMSRVTFRRLGPSIMWANVNSKELLLNVPHTPGVDTALAAGTF